jgi:hypothetical protein
MLRACVLAMALIAAPSQSASGGASPASGENAALKYWQAFATLPKFAQAENQKIGDCLTTPLDEPARKILADAEYALQMLHRGAWLRSCDWGVSYEDGVFTRLPHADAARVLTSLAYLRARQRFEAGRVAEAIDDILASMTLARHVSLDRSLTTGLVGYMIEHRAIEALAHNLPKLDARTIRDLKTRIDALPPFGSQATALLTSEKESLEWFIRKVKESKDTESLLGFLGWVGISEGKRDGGEQARAFLAACGGTAEGVLKFAHELPAHYATTARILDMPLDAVDREFKRESSKQAGNPVYQLFFPALTKVRRARARADVRRALLAAAIAVQLDGKNALKDHVDPAAGGLFEYVPFPGGFELRSKLKGQNDKPVALVVGHRD